MTDIQDVVLQVIEQHQNEVAANAVELVKSIYETGHPLSRRDVSAVASELGYSYTTTAIGAAIRYLTETGDLSFHRMEKRPNVCGKPTSIPLYVKSDLND